MLGCGRRRAKETVSELIYIPVHVRRPHQVPTRTVEGQAADQGLQDGVRGGAAAHGPLKSGIAPSRFWCWCRMWIGQDSSSTSGVTIQSPIRTILADRPKAIDNINHDALALQATAVRRYRELFQLHDYLTICRQTTGMDEPDCVWGLKGEISQWAEPPRPRRYVRPAAP